MIIKNTYDTTSPWVLRNMRSGNRQKCRNRRDQERKRNHCFFVLRSLGKTSEEFYKTSFSQAFMCMCIYRRLSQPTSIGRLSVQSVHSVIGSGVHFCSCFSSFFLDRSFATQAQTISATMGSLSESSVTTTGTVTSPFSSVWIRW